MKKWSLSSSFSCKSFVDLTFVAHAATWQKFHVECNLKRNLILNTHYFKIIGKQKLRPFCQIVSPTFTLVVLFMCTLFYPQRFTKMRSITCACGICGDYARHSVFQGVVSDLDLIIF